MSFDPPPVTPSLKLPPGFGDPVGPPSGPGRRVVVATTGGKDGEHRRTAYSGKELASGERGLDDPQAAVPLMVVKLLPLVFVMVTPSSE
jgi:hypothetical protein